MNENQLKKKIAVFSKLKESAQQRVTQLKKRFKEEKENEEAWPGHESNFIVNSEREYSVALSQLEGVKRILKKLSYKKDKKGKT